MRRHAAGDQARCLREALRTVQRPVALVSFTDGSEFDSSTYRRRVRSCKARVRVEMVRRHGLPPPRRVVNVPHVQARGALHHHEVVLCGTPDERERVALWVALLKQHAPAYGLGWVDDPLRLRHPRTPDGRPDRTRPKRDMVFREAAAVGGYLAPYLVRSQLEAAVVAGARVWVSPVLLRASGWTMQRCRWVREGWHIQRGTWRRRTWYGVAWMPTWWERPDDRAWVLAALGASP